MTRSTAQFAALRTACALGVLLFGATAAHADIYRCVDPEGNVSYGDSPCAPGDAMSANITESVQACSTAECQTQMERARAAAEERLRAERAALTEMQDRRLKAEELDLQRKLQLQQLDRMQMLESQRAADGGGGYYPAYPLYGGVGYPGYGGGWLGSNWLTGQRPCRGAVCANLPNRPGLAPYVRRLKEPVVSSFVPGPHRPVR
jgi:hypothetical protein